MSKAVSVALSWLCGASVRGCQISIVHTVALFQARGCISMGSLMGHPRPFIIHLATENGAQRGLQRTTPGRYTKPRAQDITKATLSSVYCKLISSPASFCIHKTQDGKEQDNLGQRSDRVSQWTIIMNFILRTDTSVSDSGKRYWWIENVTNSGCLFVWWWIWKVCLPCDYEFYSAQTMYFQKKTKANYNEQWSCVIIMQDHKSQHRF